jgi:hypothetical protein
VQQQVVDPQPEELLAAELAVEVAHRPLSGSGGGEGRGHLLGPGPQVVDGSVADVSHRDDVGHGVAGGGAAQDQHREAVAPEDMGAEPADVPIVTWCGHRPAVADQGQALAEPLDREVERIEVLHERRRLHRSTCNDGDRCLVCGAE